MIERILYCVLLTVLVFFVVYWLGRIFVSGIMDGVNHKFNQFINKSKENEDKEKE